MYRKKQGCILAADNRSFCWHQQNDIITITQEHIDNNAAVRKMLTERGIIPENLPPAEDVKKVERRLASEEKKMLQNKK